MATSVCTTMRRCAAIVPAPFRAATIANPERNPMSETRLIHGLDDIGLTLQHEAAIRAFEARHATQLPPR